MGTPIKQYLVWCNIERSVMKAFLQMYDTNYQNVRVQANNITKLKIDDLIDHADWKETLREHFELMDKYERDGKKVNYEDLDFYKREHTNAPEGMKNSFTQRRIDEFLTLYKNIKKNGYAHEEGKLVKVIHTGNLTTKKKPEWRSRISKEYYRLNGKRRLIICKYLGIEEIPVSLVRVRIVQL